VNHFLQYNFAPAGKPFWEGAVWPNTWAMLPCGFVAWLYARAKIAAAHAKLDAHTAELRALRTAHTELAKKLHSPPRP
jgi:hypothetical protein